MNIDEMAHSASTRLVQGINRSAGQHLRAIRRPAITSSDLYVIGMESATAQLLMPELCALLGIEYPPTL